jgi:hypothetical protein
VRKQTDEARVCVLKKKKSGLKDGRKSDGVARRKIEEAKKV